MDEPKRNTLNQVTGSRRPPLRQCDECRFARLEGEGCYCAHDNKPTFVIPESYSEIMTGEWGWRKRCSDYATIEAEPPKQDVQKEIEQSKWRKKGKGISS